MLLENLRYFKEASKMTYEQIAEASKTPLSTVKNIFSGKSEPLASTLYRISKALNVPLEDILADANVVLSSTSLIEVQETLEEVKETLAEAQENTVVVEAERNLISIENERLKVENTSLSTQLELIKKELKHKEELLAVHNFYKIHLEQLIKREGI